MAELRTQKARGLVALSNHLLDRVPQFRVFLGERIATFSDLLPGFARPCPIRPRHGFVESRRVSSLDELETVFREASAADPEAEVIVMPFIEAERSAILTSRSLTIGRGHDGATSGDGVLLHVPVHVQFPRGLLADAGVSGEPYVELVQSPDGRWKAVQLRDGPPPPDAVGELDYSGPEVQITSHLPPPADGDMLAYERAVLDAAPGTLALLPGHAPTSHAAVHARLRGIPVWYGDPVRAPKIGEVVRPVSASPKIDWRSVARNLWAAALDELLRQGRASSFSRRVRAAIWLTHQVREEWLAQPESCAIVGRSLAVLFIAAAMAVHGEWRHALRIGSRSPWHNMSRDCVYDSLLYCTATELATALCQLHRAERVFARPGWPSGYGGHAWRNCTRLTRRLGHAIYRLSRKNMTRTEAHAAVVELIAAAHAVVNAGHNNGSFLNKFANQEFFDNAAVGELQTSLKALDRLFGQYDNDLRDEADGAEKLLRSALRYCRDRVRRPPNAAARRLQIRLRDDGYHFQAPRPDGGYVSHTFARHAVSSECRAALDALLEREHTAHSLANSGAVYVPLTMSELPAEIQTILANAWQEYF